MKLRRAGRLVLDRAVAALGVLPVRPRLRVQSGRCGFFGDVLIAFNGIQLAERHGLVGQIDWGPSSLYFDPERGGNVWRYYFQDAGFAGDNAAPALGAIPYKPDAHEVTPYQGLSARASVSRLIARHCRPNPDIADAVDRLIADQFAPGRTLGVHVRLTDAAQGAEARRVGAVEAFIEEADQWVGARAGAKIFLASDDAGVAEQFRRAFGDALIAQDCARSIDGTSLHGHYDAGTGGSPYLKGREVLIDALLLGACDHLIRSHSRVTWYSLCINPEQTFTDMDVAFFGRSVSPWLADATPAERGQRAPR